MSARWSLLLLLSALSASRVGAVELVQSNERAPRARVFANGLDAFGRDASCRACHALLNALNENLIPSIAAERAKPASKSTYGAYDDMIETALAPVCRLSATWHDATTRKACEKLMESHDGDVAEAYHRWIKRGGGIEREANGRRDANAASWKSGKYDPVGWNWNYEICSRATRGACKESLAMHELAEFDDEPEGDGETRKYRSEQKPDDGETVDGMLKVTAGTFHEQVVRRAADVVAYVGFPKMNKWGHFYTASALGRVRELFQSNDTAKGAFDVAFVDGTHNDVPPPYGSDSEAPTIAMFAANNKNWPRYMSDMNDGKLTVYELLQFIMRTAASRETVRHAVWLSQKLPRATLYATPWEDDEL